MSYVVKNCPAYDYNKEWNYHICKQPLVPYECNVYDCQKCTDCVIKQVIEECKWETNIDVNDRGDLAERILSSFDIEEINK